MRAAHAPDPATPTAAEDHRRRLLEAMAQAVADKGFAATTIADVAAIARVSKRTFYEHFDGKAACLLALHDAASRAALGVLRRAIDPSRHWHAQVEQALAAYFAALGSSPALLRTLFVEILGLGDAGLAARRQAVQALADFIVEVAQQRAAEPAQARAGLPGEPGPAATELGRQLATAMVGGIDELVLQAIEQGRADRLDALVEPAGRMVRAVMGEIASPGRG